MLYTVFHDLKVEIPTCEYIDVGLDIPYQKQSAWLDMTCHHDQQP